MPYAVLKRGVILFLAAYFAAGLSLGNSKTLYPLFSWYLYPRVPSRLETDITLRIHEARGERFEPPQFLEETQGIYDRAYNKSAFRRITTRLAEKLAAGSPPEEITALRRELEEALPARPLVYEIVKIRYNPIERWKTGKVETVERIVIFRTGEKTNE